MRAIFPVSFSPPSAASGDSYRTSAEIVAACNRADRKGHNKQGGYCQDNEKDQLDIDNDHIWFRRRHGFRRFFRKFVWGGNVLGKVYGSGSHILAMVIILNDCHLVFFCGIIGNFGI